MPRTKKVVGPEVGTEGVTGTAPEAGPMDVPIPAIDKRYFKITVWGDTKIIVHRFDEKGRKEIEEKQQGAAKQKKPPRKPEEEYEAALHKTTLVGKDGQPQTVYGFPCSGFKKAAVSACRFVEGVKGTVAQGSFHVVGDYAILRDADTGEPIIPTFEKNCRTDTVRIGKWPNKTSTLRYRPEFNNWMTELTIMYNANVIQPVQIANLLNNAGFSVGIGEWRPGCGGAFGMFTVGSRGNIPVEPTPVVPPVTMPPETAHV